MPTKQIASALSCISTTVIADGWLVLAIASAPTLVVCGTVIVLVVTTDRTKRHEAITALAPVLISLVSRLRRRRFSKPADPVPGFHDSPLSERARNERCT